ncbi:MAG: CPBP family intramembrane metalloprotease [Verrucomicrobiales bacterium]|nr:CPBP family intramembrane metalloprotease [Verrucomicrobiales bacterium]
MTDSVDPTTLSVLADLAAVAVVALFLGAGVYKGCRALGFGAGWAERGRVPAAGIYRGADAAAVLVLSVLIWYGLQAMAVGERPDSALEKAAAAAGTSASQGETLSALLGNVIFMLLVAGFLLAYLRQIRGLDPVVIFGLRRLPLGRVLLYAVAFLLPTLLIVSVTAAWFMGALQEVWPDLQPQDTVQIFSEDSSPLVRGMMVLLAVVVAPLVEETLFRGFIYGVIKRFTDGWFAAGVSSLLFALAHFHLGSALPLFVLALGFTLAYERTGSLLVPMAMHALFNTTTLVLLIFAGDAA